MMPPRVQKEGLFQLTPSRRATMAREPLPEFAKFQLTPSRRATDCQIITYEQVIISTHALTEGDNSVRHFYRSAQYFNSRPHGGRRGAAKSAGMDYISTHALTEGDRIHSAEVLGYQNFNSRPHGGRQFRSPFLPQRPIFQLTPSRRATPNSSAISVPILFQLTPSRRATWFENLGIVHTLHFNSRPHGGRLFFDFRCRS